FVLVRLSVPFHVEWTRPATGLPCSFYTPRGRAGRAAAVAPRSAAHTSADSTGTLMDSASKHPSAENKGKWMKVTAVLLLALSLVGLTLLQQRAASEAQARKNPTAQL